MLRKPYFKKSDSQLRIPIQNFQIASDTSGLPTYWKFEKTQRKFLVPQKNFNSKNRATRVIVILVKVTPFEKLRKLTSKNFTAFLTSEPGSLSVVLFVRSHMRALNPIIFQYNIFFFPLIFHYSITFQFAKTYSRPLDHRTVEWWCTF